MRVVPRGLYGKLVLYVTLIIIAVISAFGFITYKQQVSRIESTANESVMLLAKNISLTCAEYVILYDYTNMEAYLKRFAELKNILEIVIYDKQGKILSNVVHEDGLQPLTRYSSESLSIPDSSEPSLHIENGKMVALYPITVDSIIVGWARLQYGLREIPYIRRAVLRNTILASILGTFVSFLALLTVLKSPTRLITSIADFAKSLDKVKGETIPVHHDFTEIEQLCEALNYASQKLSATERELMQHQEHLENLVTLRAAELAMTNEQLQQELVERKKAEERLSRYARELKENNEELRTFAYIASHDLRTPLVNMKGFAGELRFSLREINAVMNDILPSLDENNRTRLVTAFLKDVPEALGFIDSSAGRMEELINAISKLSRLGRQELKPELLQVQTIVQSALKDLQLVIEKKGIKVNVGPLPEIIADRNSLQTILGNILDNAVKYRRPGVPGEIEITAEKAPDGTVISIRDNGRGIPNEEIYKVFEMFRRVGTQDAPGEGVGLACVKTLVRRHGGRIWCESTPGQGTTFHFSIPEHVEFTDQATG
ncbi:MAG: ATP-binding protein [Nitrospirota bacterium]